MGSGGTAILTESSCPCIRQFFTILRLNRWPCPIEMVPNCRFEPIFGAMYRQFRSRRQWRKWISAAELEWSKVHAKLHGGILFNKLYFLDDQDTNPANTQRLFLRHGRYKNFRVHATACTFSSTILVDQLGDESCYLVDIARVNFMEAEGARERPLAIQYLSFQCDISPLVLSSGSNEVTKVHVRYFLQTAKTS